MIILSPFPGKHYVKKQYKIVYALYMHHDPVWIHECTNEWSLWFVRQYACV